jgi:hypothetical protein
MKEMKVDLGHLWVITHDFELHSCTSQENPKKIGHVQHVSKPLKKLV